METSLALDSRGKQLGLRFKKSFEHSSDARLKVQGLVNTVNAQCQMAGTLSKFVRLGPLPARDPSEAYCPDHRLRLGVGLKAAAIGGRTLAADDLLLSLSAKQRVTVQRSQEVVRSRVLLRSHTEAAGSAHYDYNPRREQWSGEVHARLSHAMFRFADDQDVRLTAGVRAPLSQQGLGAAKPYVRVQENCWALTVQAGGQWSISYDL